jgi:hypothetical protein
MTRYSGALRSCLATRLTRRCSAKKERERIGAGPGRIGHYVLVGESEDRINAESNGA